MTDTPRQSAIEAGRQSAAHLLLSRTLWFRQRGRPLRFLFDPAADLGLVLERVGQKGATLPARISDAMRCGNATDTGLLLVDDDEGLVFCTASDPTACLRRIAAWAQQTVAAIPAVAILADAGTAALAIDPLDDAAAQQVEPGALDVTYEPSLWDDLLRPDAATIAGALLAVPPGERMWFWLTDEPPDDGVPLIVQPLAWDPNHDRMNWLVTRNEELGAGQGATGICTICDDGSIQFLGDALRRTMLPELAAWVARTAADHPGLGRLVDCRLLRTWEASVEAIYAAPALWAGVRHQPVPGTMFAAAAVLEALPVGGECWFWITGSASDAGLLYLAPTGTDPDATAFQAELPRLYSRFAKSFGDAISGVMRRQSADTLLFSTADRRREQFPLQVRSLLDRYGAVYPALRALAGARMVQPVAGGAPRALAAA